MVWGLGSLKVLGGLEFGGSRAEGFRAEGFRV